MKTIVQLIPLALGLALAGTGCTTMPEAEAPPPATQADVGYLREEIRRLTARMDASDAELGHVQGDVQAARSSQPTSASAAQVQALQTQLDDLQRQIRAVDAARAQDKKEIYDDISKKVATLLKAPAGSSASSATTRSTTRSASQSGYEHVVKPGESLSRIAAAYNVKMSVIVEANGLKSADSIFVGQKLFIPD
jgi:LysM repeat protein